MLLNNVDKSSPITITLPREKQEPTEGATSLTPIYKGIRKGTALVSKQIENYLYSPKQLSTPIDINGEICTHRLGKAIFGSEANVKAIYGYLEQVRNHSTPLYQHMMTQLKNGDTVMVVFDANRQLESMHASAIWKDFTHTDDALKGFRKGIIIDIQRTEPLSHIAHEWLHDFISHVNEVKSGKIGALPACPTPCHTAEDYKRLFNSWFEVAKNQAPLSAHAENAKREIFTVTQRMWNEYAEVVEQLENLKKNNGPEDFAKKNARLVKMAKLQRDQATLLNRWSAEVPTYVMNAKILHGHKAVQEAAGGLCQTLDEMLGIKLFTESSQKLALKAYARLAIKYSGKALAPIGLIMNVIAGIQKEQTIPLGILRGTANFTAGLITWPVDMAAAAVKMAEERNNAKKPITAAELIQEVTNALKPQLETLATDLASMTPYQKQEFVNKLREKYAETVAPYRLTDQPPSAFVTAIKEGIIFSGKKLGEWTDKLGDFAIKGYDLAETGIIEDAIHTDATFDNIKHSLQGVTQSIKEEFNRRVITDPSATGKIAEDLVLAMKDKLDIPADFFRWSAEKRAKWGKELASQAESTMKESIARYQTQPAERPPKCEPTPPALPPESTIDNEQSRGATSLSTTALLGALAGETPLTPPAQVQCQEALLSRLDSNAEALVGCSPAEIATAAELVSQQGPQATEGQREALVKAAMSCLPDEVEFQREVEEAKAAGQALNSEELAQQIASVGECLSVISQAIFSYAHTCQTIQGQQRAHDYAAAQFTRHMDALGLDRPIEDFYGFPLPDIRKMLTGDLVASGNRWAQNAEDYKEAVNATKEALAACQQTTDQMDKEFPKLKELAEQLNRLQKRQDRYYSSRAKQQSKAGLAISILNVGGSIASLFPGGAVAGRAIGAVGSLAGIGTSSLANRNAMKWQKANEILLQKRQLLADVGAEAAASRSQVQQQIAHFHLRQRHEQELLLQAGIFTPLQQQAFLEDGIKVTKQQLAEVQRVQTEKEGRHTEVTAQLEEARQRQAWIKERIVDRISPKDLFFSKKIKFNTPLPDGRSTITIKEYEALMREYEESKLKIPGLVKQQGTLLVEWQNASNTATAMQRDLKGMKETLKTLKDDRLQPLYLRSEAHRSSLEELLYSSDEHLKSLEPLSQSEDPKQRMKWAMALSTNKRFHAIQQLEQLSNCKEPDLAALLITMLADSSAAWPQFEDAIELCEGKYRHALQLEEQARHALQQAKEKDVSIAKEADLAKLQDERLELFDKYTAAKQAFAIQQQLGTAALESLMRLPMAERRASCQQIITILTQGSALPAQVQWQWFSHCIEIDRAAEREQWESRGEGLHSALYSELMDGNRQREELLRQEIQKLEDLHHEHPTFTLEMLGKQMAANRTSRHALICEGAQDSSQALLRWASGDRTNGLEANIVASHRQFLRELNTDGLAPQLTRLSSLFEALLKQLGDPEKHKERALKARLVTSLLAVASSFSYFAFGLKDLQNRASCLRDENPQASALGLLLKCLPLLLEGYAQPLLLGVGAIHTAWNLWNMWVEGKELLPSADERLMAAYDGLSKQLLHLAEGVEQRFDRLEKGQMDLGDLIKKNGCLLEKFATGLETQLHSLKQSLKEEAVQEQLLLERRGYAKQVQEIALKLTKAKLKQKPKHYFEQLAVYAEHALHPTANSQDRAAKLDIQTIATTADCFVPAIGQDMGRLLADTKTAREFVHPKLLQVLGSRYIAWQEWQSTSAGKEKERFHSSDDKVRAQLLKWCESMEWLYKAPETALKALEGTLQTLQVPFVERRKNRLAIEAPASIWEAAVQQEIPTLMKSLGTRFDAIAQAANSLPRQLQVIEKVNQLFEKYREGLSESGTNFAKQSIWGGLVTLGGCGLATVVPVTGILYACAGMYAGMEGMALIAANAFAYHPTAQQAEKVSKCFSSSLVSLLRGSVQKSTQNEFDHGPCVDYKSWAEYCVDFTWETTTAGIKPSRAAIAITKKDLIGGKSAYKVCREIAMPLSERVSLLTVTTRVSWDGSHKSHYYHPGNQIENDQDLEKLSVATSACSFATVCEQLGAIFSAGFAKEAAEGSKFAQEMQAFNEWLGTHRLLSPESLCGTNESFGALMMPLPFPSELIDAMEKDMAMELDLYTARHPGKRLHPTYRWVHDEPQGSYCLSLHWRDEGGSDYFSRSLLEIPTVTLDAIGLSDEEDPNAKLSFAKLLYLLYGEHWGVGIDLDRAIVLSSGKQILFGCPIEKGSGYYKRLAQWHPQPTATEAGLQLRKDTRGAKDNFGDDALFKQYRHDYHLIEALLKVAYDLDYCEYGSETIKDVLQTAGFPAPESSEIFSQLADLRPYTIDMKSFDTFLKAMTKGTLEAMQTLKDKLCRV
jgi:hypothetical protein